MTDFIIEKIQKPSQQEELVQGQWIDPKQAHFLNLAILFVDLSRIVKENIEFLTIQLDMEVASRSIEIMQEQMEDHREAHRQMQVRVKHQEIFKSLTEKKFFYLSQLLCGKN